MKLKKRDFQKTSNVIRSPYSQLFKITVSKKTRDEILEKQEIVERLKSWLKDEEESLDPEFYGYEKSLRKKRLIATIQSILKGDKKE